MSLPANSFACTSCPYAVLDTTSLTCPHCGGLMTMVNMLKGPVQTTQAKTATASQYSGHVRLRKGDRAKVVHNEGNRTWVFTDGASRGSFAAVVLRKDQRPIEVSRHWGKEALAQANVTAEIMGVVLGLKNATPDSKVTVVSDYIGTGCWLAGKWRIKNLDGMFRLRLLARVIRRRKLRVTFVHHKGHQTDDSEFTFWNNRADQLCEIAAEGEPSPPPRCCLYCGSPNHFEEWGEGGEFWDHCHKCGRDGPAK